MVDAMKTHETLTKLKEKLGRYERPCIIKMEKFDRIKKKKKIVILSEGGFGKHKIKWSLPNLNPSETKRSLLNLNLEEGIRCLRLNYHCRI